MDSSVGKISWESYKNRLGLEKVWTLVHGDYHPANQLIDPKQEDARVTSLDWEMVGLGSGPQEVA